jgi:hypothetical protein
LPVRVMWEIYSPPPVVSNSSSAPITADEPICPLPHSPLG